MTLNVQGNVERIVMKKFIKKTMTKVYYYLFWVLTGIKKFPHSPNSAIKYVFPNGNIYGVFYDSQSRRQHLALYIPYKLCPTVYLCGGRMNFSPSGKENNICIRCYEKLFSSCKFKPLANFIFKKTIR